MWLNGRLRCICGSCLSSWKPQQPQGHADKGIDEGGLDAEIDDLAEELAEPEGKAVVVPAVDQKTGQQGEQDAAEGQDQKHLSGPANPGGLRQFHGDEQKQQLGQRPASHAQHNGFPANGQDKAG